MCIYINLIFSHIMDVNVKYVTLQVEHSATFV